MRELAAFYCPRCGYYAYYQTSRHPQCPRCHSQETMHMVRMHYKEFMDMSCQERDDYLGNEILKHNPSLMERLTEPHKKYNSREIIAEMNMEIMRLDTENKVLSDTIKWRNRHKECSVRWRKARKNWKPRNLRRKQAAGR